MMNKAMLIQMLSLCYIAGTGVTGNLLRHPQTNVAEQMDQKVSAPNLASRAKLVRALKGGQSKGKGKGKGKGTSTEAPYPTDDAYYQGKGKGKGKGASTENPSYPPNDDYYQGSSKSKSKSKGSSKGKGKGKGGGMYPTVDDIPFVDDQYFDDQYFADGNCELVVFNETFVVPQANLFLAPDTTPTNFGTPALPGTIFIWDAQDIYEPNGVTVINGTTISGTCTRTVRADETTNKGSGVCQLVFTDTEGFSINTDGDLQGPFGSSMAIVGGTGGMVGVIGEMDFFPVFSPGPVGDIFTNVTGYTVVANLGLIVCPGP